MESSLNSLALPCRSSGSFNEAVWGGDGPQLRCIYSSDKEGDIAGRLRGPLPLETPAPVGKTEIPSPWKDTVHSLPYGLPTASVSGPPMGGPSEGPQEGPSCAICGKPASRRLLRVVGEGQRLKLAGGDSLLGDTGSASSFAVGRHQPPFCSS